MVSNNVSIRLLQSIDPAVADDLVTHLESLFSLKCTLKTTPLDISFAFVPTRKQYDSTAILTRIKATILDEARALLAIVSDDLFAAGLNFVFGEAEVGGKVAIISLARLRPSFWGMQESMDLLNHRARKEATHELGHVMGLRHCIHKRCVMYLSATLDDTDRKSERFCPDCAHLLAETIIIF